MIDKSQPVDIVIIDAIETKEEWDTEEDFNDVNLGTYQSPDSFPHLKNQLIK